MIIRIRKEDREERKTERYSKIIKIEEYRKSIARPKRYAIEFNKPLGGI